MTSQGQTCATSSLQTFPISLSFPINTESYSFKNPLPLNITFSNAVRSSPPGFDNTGTGVLTDEPTQSSLRYLGYTYTLSKVQFTQPLHKSWIIPIEKQVVNMEDIVITYTRVENIKDVPKVIIINIPIIRSDVTSNDPPYLAALANPNLANVGITIANVFPNRENDLYAYYNICVQGSKAGDLPSNILSIVIVRGFYVSNTLMDNIFAQYNQLTTYKGYEAPIGIAFNNSQPRFDNTAFNANVNHGYNLTEYLPPNPAGTLHMRDINAYQCVPFSPEKDISGGKIVINPDTGLPYTNIEEERKALIAEATNVNGKPIFNEPAFLMGASQYISYVTAGIVFIFLLYILFSTSTTSGIPGEHSSFLVRGMHSMRDVPIPLIAAIIAGLIGYVVGVAMK